VLALDQKLLERRSLGRNELLFRQGDKVRAIYFIEEGRLRLERRTFDGRLLILGTTPANEFFVEAALFSEIFHCDAVAAEPSRVRVYPKAAVLEALRTDPASAMSFLELVAHEIIELRQRLELMKVRSAKERVMLYLDFNAGPSGTVNLPGTLQDVASELGLTREALYRTLASLEQTGASNAPSAASGSRKRSARDRRELLWLFEYRSRLVGNHEPATILFLEHIRYKGIEADSFAILAQELHFLDTDGPCDIFGQRDRDAIELAEAHFPGLPDALPADHNRGTERADECRIGLVRPHLVHCANVTCCYRRDENLARSIHLLDVRRTLGLCLV
jgi:CRP/FNR family transcriptional regulator, dissimilatory nitrate respiration regulator